MAFAKDFIYDGTKLSDIDQELIVISFNTTSSESDIISRTVNRSPLTYDESITYDYGAVDNDVYKFSLTLARNDDQPLTQELMRKLVKWLMSPHEPKWLKLTKCEGVTQAMYDNVWFHGRFVRAVYEESAGYYKNAVTFDFENTTPYGFTDEQTWSYTFDGTSTTLWITAPGTVTGKMITPLILITSNADATAGYIDLEKTDGYVTDQTQENDPIELENGTTQDGQTISLFNHQGNTASFKIKIPRGKSVAIMDDNCYEFDAEQGFDPDNLQLYSFENLINFNWPKMVSGGNMWTFVGDMDVTIKARFFEALGV